MFGINRTPQHIASSQAMICRVEGILLRGYCSRLQLVMHSTTINKLEMQSATAEVVGCVFSIGTPPCDTICSSTRDNYDTFLLKF